jgi:tol-pal system protein YbgF
MKRLPVAVVAALLTCAIPATALAQNREHQQMAAELRILQEQNLQLSLALQKTLVQLEEAVKSINTRLDASDAATRKALADQKLIIDSASTELRVIRERTQDSSTRIGTLTEEVEALRKSVTSLAAQQQQQMQLLQQQQPAIDPDTGLPIEPPPVASTAPPPPPASLGISPTRLYQSAWNDYTSGQFSLAISGFEQFLREFPTSELADDAQLHIGRSHMSERRFQEAAAAFSSLIRTYPSGDKLPEAHLELGQAQAQLGQTDLARKSWETVVNNYQGSSSESIARQRLQGLATP